MKKCSGESSLERLFISLVEGQGERKYGPKYTSEKDSPSNDILLYWHHEEVTMKSENDIMRNWKMPFWWYLCIL